MLIAERSGGPKKVAVAVVAVVAVAVVAVVAVVDVVVTCFGKALIGTKYG